MRRIGVFLIMCACFASALWAQSPKPNVVFAPAPLILYDDFNGQRIDPAKWSDSSSPYYVREMVRELSPAYQGQGNNRRLRMFDRAYSDTFNDSGGTNGWLALQFAHPTSVNEVSFTLAVNTATVSNCQSNPDVGTVTWAGFVGRFFNYGGYGDPNQDVTADLNLYPASNASGPFYVVASVNSYDGVVQEAQVLGTVSLGQTAKLRLNWDQANSQFVFQWNSNPVVVIGYKVHAFPAVTAIKELWVGHGVPECASAPLASATIDAYFDNVYVNAQ